MTNTPNHSYNTPGEGTSDWHIPLNENFEQLDIDVEIRAPEEDKGDYEPKQGAKYEATDSGAIYYGDGNSWILANRKVVDLQSKKASAGRLYTAGNGGAAVVAPSYDDCYSSIQSAFNDGHRFIYLAEDVVEGDITPPTGGSKKMITGIGGQNGLPKIVDPNVDGTPIINTDPNDDTFFLYLQNFQIIGEDGSGPAIDARVNDSSEHSPSSWRIMNLVTRAGPVLLGNSYRTTIINCDFENKSSLKYTVSGKDCSPSIAAGGTTFSIHGGTYKTNYGPDNAIFGCGGFSFTGGITFNNEANLPKNKKFDLSFQGALNGTVSGAVTEGTDGDIRFGFDGTSGAAATNVVFIGVGMTIQGEEALIELNNNAIGVLFLGTRTSANTRVEKNDSRASMLFIDNSQNSLTVNGSIKSDIMRLSYGADGDLEIGRQNGGTTALTYPVCDSPPEFPNIGNVVIADGENWDPDSDGKAEKVIYNGSRWIEETDLGTKL